MRSHQKHTIIQLGFLQKEHKHACEPSNTHAKYWVYTLLVCDGEDSQIFGSRL